MSDATPTPGNGHASGSHYQPSLTVVLIIVVLFVGATYLMVRTVTPSTAASGTTTTTTIAGTTGKKAPPVDKSKVSVQVANGTNYSGLAAHYTQKLQVQNWDTLPAGNGPAVKATVVYFHPNFQAAAKLVAKTIGVSATSVRPLGNAKPVTGYANDDVIVILGPNSRLPS
jgi:hypothetical protein